MRTIKQLHDFYMSIYNLMDINKGFVTFKFKNGSYKKLGVKGSNFNTEFINNVAVATIETFEIDPSNTKTYNLEEVESVS